MILQPTPLHRHVSFPSTSSYSISPPGGFRVIFLPPAFPRHDSSAISCSVSGTSGHRTVDYERRPSVKWSDVYRRISFMENPEMGSASVLNQWESEGKRLTKWELCRVIKELRKFRKFRPALEVYEWMNNRIRISCSDAAIQLDLVSKVRGIQGAEDFFTSLPDNLKDGRTHGALLNAYAQAKMKDKAEVVLNTMRNKGYVTAALSLNVMMTLYMNLREYDKVEMIISEMSQNNIPLDAYSYNIWLSSRGFQGWLEGMEQSFAQMELDQTVTLNWTTFTTMATVYIKSGQLEKADECLKKAEVRIFGMVRMPYHFLISLYGSIGNKGEVLRLWDAYKSGFQIITNAGYLAVISSLVRIGDFEMGKRIYEEWLGVKRHYDPRIGNLIIGWHARQGSLEKAEEFLEHMVEVGGKPNSATWESLAWGHARHGRAVGALSCLKEAGLVAGSKRWRPRRGCVVSVWERCEAEGDGESKEGLMELLGERGLLENRVYAAIVGLAPALKEAELPEEDDEKGGGDGDGVEALLGQLQSSAP